MFELIRVWNFEFKIKNGKLDWRRERKMPKI